VLCDLGELGEVEPGLEQLVDFLFDEMACSEVVALGEGDQVLTRS